MLIKIAETHTGEAIASFSIELGPSFCLVILKYSFDDTTNI